MPTPMHDGLIQLSVGASRYEDKWKNKEVSWSDLLKKLSKTTHTAETYAEYMAFPKKIQDEKKDVGGFVGGIIRGGHRKGDTVLNRTLLTLDIDFGSVHFWDDFKMTYSNAACIYGTHKHHPANPRYRLIIPLSREILPDEYQAVSRKMAEAMDIDIFDPTTFQVERLMYWPSTPSDQPYYYEWQDGPFMDPDTLLGLYYDWKDTSQWAISRRAKQAIYKNKEKQGEPTEKNGVVGAFCRIYSISEAIAAYLSDLYLPTADADRYSYVHGSTSSGLVLYEDKFAFSHHGSDPISGKLCNAFDLVRIHKFGVLDEDSKPDTPINRRPSHLKMEELALKDKSVNTELVKTRLASLREDFDGVLEEGHQGEDLSGVVSNKDEDPDAWKSLLKGDKSGKLLSTSTNCLIILQYDPELKKAFGYNSFQHVDVAMSNLPWRKIEQKEEPLTDVDDAGLRNYFEKNYEIASAAKIKDAFIENRMRVSFHPIVNYLQRLRWDLEERIDTLLIDYFGAEDNDYSRAVSRKALTAGVARVFEPGCKYDNVPVIIGSEGLGKSTFLAKLGQGWFSNSLGPIDNVRAAEQLQGAWLIEIAELAAFKRSQIEMVKHFVSKQRDRFRVAYGVRVEEFLRQCFFWGTTNEDDFLVEANGNRRFWPVKARRIAVNKSVFDDLTDREINQIWAEAVYRYRSGETLHLSPELEKLAFEKQQQHTERDEREDVIRDYLDAPIQDIEQAGLEEQYRNRVSVAELWVEALRGLKKEMTPYNTKPIHAIMKKMKGWRRINTAFRTDDYGVQKGYERIEKRV